MIAFGVIYNVAHTALSERSRDLATLHVIGFSQAEVALVLLGEQAILTLAATPLGFALGYGVAATLSTLYNSELYRFPLGHLPSDLWICHSGDADCCSDLRGDRLSSATAAGPGRRPENTGVGRGCLPTL